MNHSICCAEKVNFISHLNTLSFSHAKTTPIHSPSICILSIGAQHPHSHMPRRDLHKRRRKKEEKRTAKWWTSGGIVADSADMSEQEWRSLKLSAIHQWLGDILAASASAWCFPHTADERRWREAWNALDFLVTRRTAICLRTDAPVNSGMGKGRSYGKGGGGGGGEQKVRCDIILSELPFTDRGPFHFTWQYAC